MTERIPVVTRGLDRDALRLCGAICLVAAVARVIPAFGDFWLDEIWTWAIVRPLHGAGAIFERIHHSNNNHLNSLFFYWIGDRENWIWYRVPALITGIAAVPLAVALAARRGRLEAVFAAILTGGCFALIHFSSEARGYSPAVFFALAATWFLERSPRRPSAASIAAFNACVILGFLSHLVFLFYVAGAATQSAWRLLRPAGDRRLGALRFAALYTLPLLALLALYRIDLRYLHVGGGNVTDWAEWLSRCVGFTLGLPVLAPFAGVYLVLAGGIAALGVRRSWRNGDDEWILASVVILLAPLGVLLVMRPEVVAVRYFLIGIAFYLLLAARTAAHLYRAGGWRRAACVGAVGIFLAGNAAHFVPFARLGRGGYSAAVRFMAESSSSPKISVGSDHDFRNGMVLRFYARTLPEDRRLLYHERGHGPRGGPEWFIVHAGRRPTPPALEIADANGHRFEFVRGFDHAAISGFWWGVYRNVSRDSGGASDAADSIRRSTTTPNPRP